MLAKRHHQAGDADLTVPAPLGEVYSRCPGAAGASVQGEQRVWIVLACGRKPPYHPGLSLWR
jgi:hypothetical protein